MPADRGILVTGLPRSGTSWVGKMLEANGEVVYVNEPMNPQHPPGRSPGVLNKQVSHRHQYICDDNGEPWARAFADTLRLRYHPLAELRRNHAPYDLARLAKYFSAFVAGRAAGRRALIDDPFATLSAAWFARLGIHVILLVRNPVSFVGSWQNLGWAGRMDNLLAQPLLMRDLLGPYESEMRELADSPDSIARTALFWRMTYAVLDGVADRYPNVHLRRYEDLASAPEAAFHELYDRCGLTWNDQAQQRIVAATTTHKFPEAQGFAWSLRGGVSRTAFRPMDSRAALSSASDRLSPAEIDRVRDLTSEVAKRYYDPAEYDASPTGRHE